MKKSITTLVLLFSSIIVTAQFTEIPTGTTADLVSIEESEGTLFILGNGFLAKSTDLGDNIIPINSPLAFGYSSALNLKDTLEYYYITTPHDTTFHYKIIGTQNGGITWTTEYEHIYSYPLYDMGMSNNGNLLAVGRWGKIFKAQNGGAWSMTGTTTNKDLMVSVSLTDQTFLVGGTGYVGRTDNFGSYWHETPVHTSTCYVRAICPIDNNTIYLAIDDNFPVDFYFSKSTDGGLSWQTNLIQPEFNVTDMKFISPNRGFAIGKSYYQNYSGVLETNDGGATWTLHNLGPNKTLSNLTILNTGEIFIVGHKGLLLKTTLRLLDLTENPSLNKEISIYPNPGNTYSPITIRAEKIDYYTAELFDLTGRKLYETKFQKEVSLNVTSRGAHLLKITNSKLESVTRKIIIQE